MYYGLTTQDPYILKEHTELYKVLKFRVNWANIEQDTANIYLVVCTLLYYPTVTSEDVC